MLWAINSRLKTAKIEGFLQSPADRVNIYQIVAYAPYMLL